MPFDEIAPLSITRRPSATAQDFNYLTAVLFTLNYIIGTGFLTIPWAFSQSGLLLGSLTMILIVLPSTISAYFVLETMARAEGLALCRGTPRGRGNSSYQSIPGWEQDPKEQQLPNTLWLVGSHKYEVSELCEMFLGSGGLFVYTSVATLYFYGTLAAYATVFASSFASNCPLGAHSYQIYLALFALVVVPPSCWELNEQVTLQVVYSYCRGVILSLMIGTAVIAYVSTNVVTFTDAAPTGNVKMVDWSGLSIILPISLYAYIFQHSIPSLAEPCVDKKKLPQIYITTLVLVCVVMTTFGGVLSAYFGSGVQSSVNTNWVGFAIPWGGVFGTGLGNLIGTFVVFFPAINVVSVYPLNAITLGNNLLVAFGGNTNTSNVNVKMFFRLIAACPPICLALVVRNLGQITGYTGITGFVLVFIFPAILAYASKKYLLEKKVNPCTYYSSVFTSDVSVFLTVCFGAWATLYVTLSILIPI